MLNLQPLLTTEKAEEWGGGYSPSHWRLGWRGKALDPEGRRRNPDRGRFFWRGRRGGGGDPGSRIGRVLGRGWRRRVRSLRIPVAEDRGEMGELDSARERGRAAPAGGESDPESRAAGIPGSGDRRSGPTPGLLYREGVPSLTSSWAGPRTAAAQVAQAGWRRRLLPPQALGRRRCGGGGST